MEVELGVEIGSRLKWAREGYLSSFWILPERALLHRKTVTGKESIGNTACVRLFRAYGEIHDHQESNRACAEAGRNQGKYGRPAKTP